MTKQAHKSYIKQLSLRLSRGDGKIAAQSVSQRFICRRSGKEGGSVSRGGGNGLEQNAGRSAGPLAQGEWSRAENWAGVCTEIQLILFFFIFFIYAFVLLR